MTGGPDPIDEWREISARAGGASGYRASSPAEARRSAGWSIGALTLALALGLGGLALRPATNAGGPVVARADDGMFRLELSTPHGTYGPNDAIEPVATVTYLGPDASVTVDHATYPVGFAIAEVGGHRAMDGGSRLPCGSTTLTKSTPSPVPFSKGGSPTSDESTGFDLAWYQDPVLRLPMGTWRIVASMNISVGDCRGSDQRHRLSVENVIQVVGARRDASDGPVTTPTASSSPVPLQTLSADAVAAREIARTYVDALATGHPEQAWSFLSRWSRTAVGSSTTFADAERRTAMAMPGPVVIGDPSRDPALLDPAFLGARASDIAASAGPARTFVVPVRHPHVAAAAAKTQNLVVAAAGGTWKIWLDTWPDAYGAWPYPEGCAAFSLSARRCEAVVEAAASQVGIDRTKATATWLMADPGCGEGPPSDLVILCTRTTSFVAGVRFDAPGVGPVRGDIFCGVGPPTLVCSETPGIQAVDLHGGYWDVPCAGEAPDGCPSPLPSFSAAKAASGTDLRIQGLDIQVGATGHREVEIGTAILVDGLVQEARFSVGDQTQEGFLLDPGVVRMELRSTIPGRPPFNNAYERGTFEGLELVKVVLIFDVAETSPNAVIHITDVLVR